MGKIMNKNNLIKNARAFLPSQIQSKAAELLDVFILQKRAIITDAWLELGDLFSALENGEKVSEKVFSCIQVMSIIQSEISNLHNIRKELVENFSIDDYGVSTETILKLTYDYHAKIEEDIKNERMYEVNNQLSRLIGTALESNNDET